MGAPPPANEPSLEQRLQVALGERYRLGPILGRGGFGLVFAAEELALGRAVAVKLLRPELAAPLLHERFRREAASAAQLRHPHIIPIYAVGERDDLAWFVMPRIEGESLRQRLERSTRLPIGEARRILLEVASALVAAHQAGIIHRDVKPDNILLDGPEGRTILTDFGIAKSLHGSAVAGELSTSGLILGTPHYMSPEQAGGEPTIGPQSDIYSLGVVAYLMLTGRLPFDGQTPGGILMEQLRRPPVPVLQLRQECPSLLAQVVERCLRVEPGERWQAADELISALARGSVPALRLPGTEPTAASARNEAGAFRRTVLACGVALLAALAVDLARGVPVASPIVAVLAGITLAGWYGSLWLKGYDWRSLARADSAAMPTARPEVGSRAAQARRDRAAILKRIAALPRAERGRWAPLPAMLDRAIGELERLEGSDESGSTEGIAVGIARLRADFERRGTAGKDLAEEIRRLVEPRR